ncbi:MAG: T9SS type A sorting domain-containing protein [Saprospiraceae bacterium]|nr:T9SS type A sorting domain-containing protein [Saprospiraceae bacterium]
MISRILSLCLFSLSAVLVPNLLLAQSSMMEVYSIFQTSCMPCHSNAQQEAGLDLEGTGLTANLKALNVAQNLVGVAPTTASAHARGEARIFPGRPDKSFLFKKINNGLDPILTLDTEDGQGMPAYGGPAITNNEREVIRQWIQYGAKTTGTWFDRDLIDDYYTNGGIQSFPDGPPPPPAAGEGFQVHMGPFYLPKGGEVEYYQKYGLDLPEDVEVNRIEILIGNDSHHFIIYDFDSQSYADAIPAGLRLNADHSGIGLVAAVQYAQDLVLPENTAFHWEAGLTLDLNSHYINYSGILPLQAEAYLNIYTQPMGTAKQEMYSTLLVNPNIPIPNNNTLITHSQNITYPSTEVFLWGMMGHTHKYGKSYKAYHRMPGGQKGDMIYDGACPNGVPGCVSPWFDYQHIPMRYFEEFYPVKINSQSGLIHEASWINDGPNSVNFGPTSNDEMMVLIMMYVTDTTGLTTDLDLPNGVAPGILNVSPNPTTGQVNINVPDIEEWLTLKVYDVTGKVVFQTSFQGPTNCIDLSAYNSSMYFIRVSDLHGLFNQVERVILLE